jgi:Lar family restriction alleviation protein
MTHTTKTPSQLRAEIAEREAALAAMEAVDPLLEEAETLHQAWVVGAIDGRCDAISLALAALRRGMELAKPTLTREQLGDAIVKVFGEGARGFGGVTPDNITALHAALPLAPAEPVSQELLPCPFCGDEAELGNGADCYGHGYYYIGCPRCGARGPSYYDMNEAPPAWNTRHQSTAPLIEALEALIEATDNMALATNCGMADDKITAARAALASIAAAQGKETT